MRNLMAILIGCVVSVAVFTLLLGPENLSPMLLLLVQCTAGVGLIPLLFLDWLVGLLVLSFFPGGPGRAAGRAGSTGET